MVLEVLRSEWVVVLLKPVSLVLVETALSANQPLRLEVRCILLLHSIGGVVPVRRVTAELLRHSKLIIVDEEPEKKRGKKEL